MRASAQRHVPSAPRIVKPSSWLAGDERRTMRITSLDFAFHVNDSRNACAASGEPSTSKRMRADDGPNVASAKSGDLQTTSFRP